MKKLLFVFFSAILCVILSLSVSAAVEDLTPTFSHSVIEAHIDDSAFTDVFSFQDNTANIQFGGSYVHQFDSLTLDISATDLLPNDPDAETAFFTGFDVIFTVTGDPGFIAAFINGGVDYSPVELVIFHQSMESDYYVRAQRNQYSIDHGTTWKDFNQYSFRSLSSESEIMFRLYFVPYDFFPAHDLHAYINYPKGGYSSSPVGSFSIHIDYSNFQIGSNVPIVAPLLPPISGGHGAGASFDSIQGDVELAVDQFNLVIDYFLYQFNSILSVVSSGAGNFFNMFINPLGDIVLNVAGVEVPLVITFLTIFLFVFIVYIVKRIMG